MYYEIPVVQIKKLDRPNWGNNLGFSSLGEKRFPLLEINW